MKTNKQIEDKAKKCKIKGYFTLSLISVIAIIYIISTLLLGAYLANYGEQEIGKLNSSPDKVKAAIADNKRFLIEDTLGVKWYIITDSNGNVTSMKLSGSKDEDYDSNISSGKDLYCDVYIPVTGTYLVKDGEIIYSINITNTTNVSIESDITAMNGLYSSNNSPRSAEDIASEIGERQGGGVSEVKSDIEPLIGYDFTGYSANNFMENNVIIVEDTWGVNWRLTIDLYRNVTNMELSGSLDSSEESDSGDNYTIIPRIYIPTEGKYNIKYNDKIYNIQINYSVTRVNIPSDNHIETCYNSTNATIDRGTNVILNETPGIYDGYNFTGHSHNNIDVPFISGDYCEVCGESIDKILIIKDTVGVTWQLSINNSGLVTNMKLLDSEDSYEEKDLNNNYNKIIPEVYIPLGTSYKAYDYNTNKIYDVSIVWDGGNGTIVEIPLNTIVSKLYINGDCNKDSDLIINGNVVNTFDGSNGEFDDTLYQHTYAMYEKYINVEDTWGVNWILEVNTENKVEKMTIDSSKNNELNYVYVPGGSLYTVEGREQQVSIQYAQNTGTKVIIPSDVKITKLFVNGDITSDTIIENGTVESLREESDYDGYNFTGHNHDNINVPYISQTFYNDNGHWKHCEICNEDIKVSDHNIISKTLDDTFTYTTCSECGWTESGGEFTSSRNLSDKGEKFNQSSSIRFTFNTSVKSTLRFTYVNLGDRDFQFMKVTLDDNEIISENGNREWKDYENNNIQPGEHHLDIVFNWPSGYSGGENCAKIDELSLTPNKAAYRVEHWKQKVNGNADIHDSTNYEIVESDTITSQGIIGVNVPADVKTYTGFESPEKQNKVIEEGKTTVVQYYYKRNSYQLTVNAGTGIKSVNPSTTTNVLYGASVTVSATLKDNTPQYTYGWRNWTGEGITGSNNQSYTFTMPAENVTLTANGTETINSYLQKVQVRYQNPDGTYGNYTDVINRNYNYGETVSWSVEATDIYKAASIESYTVTVAKTTQVSIDRQTHTVTLNKGLGIASVGAGPVSARKQ